jgi:hypothetical protein
MIPTSPIVFRLSTSTGKRGTAFLLKPGYVLTAAHCVFDGGDAEELEVRLESSGHSYTSIPIWRDDLNADHLGLDAAILWITGCSPPNANNQVPPVDVGRLPMTQLPCELHWHSFGYPVMDTEQFGLDLTGTVTGVQQGSSFRRLQLTCDQFGAEGIGLQGASGAPVTVNGQTIGVISRNPKVFKQRIVYASLIEDIFSEFFRSTQANLITHIEVLKASFGVIQAIELDECDQALNKYLASLRRSGIAFHEQAVRTPRCITGKLEGSSLDSTYVETNLFKISDVHDFWTNETGCRPSQAPNNEIHDTSLAKVVNQSDHNDGRLQLLITGDAGAGKTTLLNYIGLKALFAPSDIGLSEPMLPLILSLPELARVSSIDGFAGWLDTARSKGLEVCSPRLDPTFFDEFPNRVGGARWLLLFDGFDEVPELIRKDLYRSLRECVHRSSLHWCITSRAATSLADPIIDISQKWQGVRSFKMVPWTDKELYRFASALLGSEDKARDFMGQFKFIALDRSTTTPLLTLIGICVYEQYSGKLPRSKTELYDLFIDDAILRGLQRTAANTADWIDQNDREPLVDLLSQLALYSIDNPSFDRADQLEEWFQSHLQNMALANSMNVRKRTRELIQHVAAGSGLLLINDKGRWRWWHSTVRDYLAAIAIANSPQVDRIDRLQNWENSIWQEIIIFMMAVLSEKHRRNPARYANVTTLFENLINLSNRCGLLLYISLAEGAAVDEQMEEFVIASLVQGAVQIGKYSECADYDLELSRKGRSPVELLSKLSDRPAAIKGLIKIKNDMSVESWMRKKAGEALTQLSNLANQSLQKPVVPV